MRRDWRAIEDNDGDSEPEEIRGRQRMHSKRRRNDGEDDARTPYGNRKLERPDFKHAPSSDDSASDDDHHQLKELHDDDDEDPDADIPLGQVLAMHQNGSRAGPALHRRHRLHPSTTDQQREEEQQQAKKTKREIQKRDNKHRPVEMKASKRPVSIFRETLQGGLHRGHDPRFDPLIAGAPNEDTKHLARKRYAFLYDEKLPEERGELQEALKKTKNEKRKAELKAQLVQIKQAAAVEESRRKKEAREEEERRQRQEARAAGNAPYYLKKSERKRQELLAKYDELKKGGKLDRYMEKRRKKNAAKDHRYVPVSRHAR